MKKTKLFKLILSALFLSIALVLPLLTGQIKEIGNALCPMHFPVILCGFFCGPFYAGIVGFIAPLLRFLIFGMPQIMPSAIAMCFELASYGILTGILYRIFPDRKIYIYITLLAAMLSGRIIWGAVTALLLGISGSSYSLAAFLAGSVLNAVPGIILQIILIPLIVMAVNKAMPALRQQ